MITERPGTQTRRTSRTAVTTVGKVDDAELSLAAEDAVEGEAGESVGAVAVPVLLHGGVAVELADLLVQRLQGRVSGNAYSKHRQPRVPDIGLRAVAVDLTAVEGASERVGDGGLAQSR